MSLKISSKLRGFLHFWVAVIGLLAVIAGTVWLASHNIIHLVLALSLPIGWLYLCTYFERDSGVKLDNPRIFVAFPFWVLFALGLFAELVVRLSK